MKKEFASPTLELHLPFAEGATALSGHLEKGKEILQETLPKEFFDLSFEESNQWFSSNLPIVKWEEPKDFPTSLSLYFLCSPSQEVKADKVLPELIRKWLIPEKEVQILGLENVYFHMREISDRLFFASEVKILVENATESRTIVSNLPLLSTEFGLSLSSSLYLERVLDTKALSFDQKSALIQNYLRKLIFRMPKYFDIEIFREMSTFFALAKPEFRKFRNPKHVTKLIISHYLMRKKLLHEYSIAPEKRHLEFRFSRTKLHFPFGEKPVLGLSIAVGLTDSYELFDERHVIGAVQEFVPDAQVVKGSYYYYSANQDLIKYLYLEIEKKDGSLITPREVEMMRSELEEELKKRVEKLIPSVFMIRNEEEVMRNVLLLSQELKQTADLPQVMVNFDKQEADQLYFTVLLVRVLNKGSLPLEKAFQSIDQPFIFIPDRVQNVGYIRKKSAKEANVFQLSIPKERSILRANSSVNFYLAREKIIAILTEALGEIRDYNGGMIVKQGELFSQLKDAFGRVATRNQELLENFFFGLNPIEAQATTRLKSLETLFSLLLEAKEKVLVKRESYFKKIVKTKDFVYVIIRSKDRSIETVLNEGINKIESFSNTLVHTQVNHQGTFLLGLIYESSSSESQNKFQALVEKAIEKWVKKMVSQQVLRLSFFDLPPSLDPRIGGDEMSSTLMKMLFEGLMRSSKEGKIAPAIAEKVDISKEQTRYTFTLKKSYWSDGTPLVAYDFEYAWKKILSPSFYTPFVYFFYPIKHAKAAKEGRIELDQVGVKALDDQTLIVELETPTPEFLELTAHALYSPVHHKLEALHPNWAQSGEEVYVCNGPFKLKRHLIPGGYELAKNPTYWDQEKVKLDKVFVSKNNSETAFEMYQNDELEWIGLPFRPWENYFDQNTSGDSIIVNSMGTQWCVFNTQRFPFDTLKMRQAFTHAIDRKALVNVLADPPIPAVTPLSFAHVGPSFNEKVPKRDRELACRLFEDALRELGLTRKSFPVITLCCPASSAREMIAEELARQWEEVFGIRFRVEKYDFSHLFPKITNGEFQLATIIWKSWINNPVYTLNVFQYRTDRINFSKWEHPEYQKLLGAAKRETNREKQFTLFWEAEKLLVEECPVLPLNYEDFKSLKKKSLKDAFCSDAFNVDFKEAYIAPE
ncbi:MAG: Oligopeptide-binding protein OppA [Chlamydiae bacterium]|nr:Oligopeptide-binding protein OppA [Chlamydiota bacterium]